MKKIIVASAVACAVGASFWSGIRSAGADGLYISLGVGDTEAAAGPLGSRNTTIDATALNQTFTVQVFADVYGNDADGNNDGLQELNFSLLNAATGTTGTSISPFHAAAPFNAAPSFQRGAAFSVVTNGVTSMNRGSPNGGPAGNFIFTRATAPQINSVVSAQNAFFGSSNSLLGTPISNANGNGSEFYLGSATITITHLGSDSSFNAVPELSANGAPVTSRPSGLRIPSSPCSRTAIRTSPRSPRTPPIPRLAPKCRLQLLTWQEISAGPARPTIAGTPQRA